LVVHLEGIFKPQIRLSEAGCSAFGLNACGSQLFTAAGCTKCAIETQLEKLI
jgi:hypothetical protein